MVVAVAVVVLLLLLLLPVQAAIHPLTLTKQAGRQTGWLLPGW